jgi:hypothetical protein
MYRKNVAACIQHASITDDFGGLGVDNIRRNGMIAYRNA